MKSHRNEKMCCTKLIRFGNFMISTNQNKWYPSKRDPEIVGKTICKISTIVWNYKKYWEQILRFLGKKYKSVFEILWWRQWSRTKKINLLKCETSHMIVVLNKKRSASPHITSQTPLRKTTKQITLSHFLCGLFRGSEIEAVDCCCLHFEEIWWHRWHCFLVQEWNRHRMWISNREWCCDLRESLKFFQQHPNPLTTTTTTKSDSREIKPTKARKSNK